METPNLQQPQQNTAVPLPTVPQAVLPKQHYRWWRIIIWLVAAILINYLSIYFPLQKGEDRLILPGRTSVEDYNCTTHYTGFPLPTLHTGVDKLQSINPFVKTAWAQVTLNAEDLGPCLPGCSGGLGSSASSQLINMVIYILVFVGIDILVTKKQSKKYYYLLIPIFAVLVVMGMFIPPNITDLPRL